jgi:hypothetical protein
MLLVTWGQKLRLSAWNSMLHVWQKWDLQGFGRIYAG